MKNSSAYYRKDDHIQINLDKDVNSQITTGLDTIELEHCALPELDFEVISTEQGFLGHKLAFPLLISSMTGGTKKSEKINIHLAEAAENQRIAFCLGSMRVAIEEQIDDKLINFRHFAPTIPIYANIGAVQLNYGVGLPECLKLVRRANANGLILHLNPLQEVFQREGNTNFSGLLTKIEQLQNKLSVPLIVKEVGWGISPRLVKKLEECGVAAVDIAGAGGTSWSQVEMYRESDESKKRIASHFRDWGIPTGTILKDLQKLSIGIPIIASGGIRTGIDIAKCLALGADVCGIARPLLPLANESTEKVIESVKEIKQELKIAMFACGSKDIASMKNVNTFEK